MKKKNYFFIITKMLQIFDVKHKTQNEFYSLGFN